MKVNLPPGCPVPQLADNGIVALAHGDGAGLSRQLIHQRILPAFQSSFLNLLGDAACLPPVEGPLAMTTDSFVVSPLFFPGGDIGSLAITGTLNDLAVAGAEPLWVSVAFIIEEGLPLHILDRVLRSMKAVANEASVSIVAGDTKVVPKGAADQLFITTTGVGRLGGILRSDPRTIQSGDCLVVSGPIAQHGMAVMRARDSLGIESSIESDCGLLFPAVKSLHREGIPVRAMRDATRGGVAGVLHEWASQCGHTLTVQEASIPLHDQTRGMCELLGLDPLLVANEGTMLVAVPEGWGERTVQALQQVPISSQARMIGSVRSADIAPVTVIRSLGRDVPLDEPAGAMLPRIC